MTAKTRHNRIAAALAGVVVLASGGSCDPHPGADPPGTSSPSKSAAVQAAVPQSPKPAVVPAGLEPLVGAWGRTDAIYVLEIRSISPDGTVDAAYSNPRPIHVARAMAARGDDAVTLFVELRDLNYPGSTYALHYDPARDVLEGTYFQAIQRVTFDVSFTRR